MALSYYRAGVPHTNDPGELSSSRTRSGEVLEKIERLAETRERQIPCSVWASAWAPKTKKMRLLEIRRAHPLNHREPLVHTFAYQTVLFKITSDRSCCRAETPRAHPEVLSSRDAPFGGWNLSEEYRLHMTREQQGVLFLV